MLHPDVAVSRVEGKAEYRGANQDEQYKRCQFGRVFKSLFGQGQAQPALAHGQNQCAQCAHGTAFGRRCDTQKNRAQHQKDQDQRGHQHEGHLLSQFGQQVHFGDVIDDGQRQSGQRRQCHGQDDDFIPGRRYGALQPASHQSIVNL